MSWTRRTALASGLGVLFFLVLSNWLGLLRNSGGDLVVEAALMTLIGSYAVRVSAFGAALSLFLALFALNADQATIALGLPALPVGTPDDYWLRSTLPAASVWAAYPLLARAIASRLPRWLSGLAIAAALLPLPALRYFLQPDRLADVYLHPRPGNYALLPVPWLALVALTAVLASAAIALSDAPHPRRRPSVVAALIMLTVLFPIGSTVRTEAELRSAIEISPASGGPLTTVTVRSRLAPDVAVSLQWDEQSVTTGAFLEPLRPFTFGGVTRADFLPATVDARAGTHQVTLLAGDERRVATFAVTPPTGLVIVIADGHVVVRGGAPNAEFTILTIGLAGPERLTRTFDGSGAWRSPLAPADAATLTIYAQSGGDWAVLHGITAVRRTP